MGEYVGVGVVDGELQEDGSRVVIDPVGGNQVGNHPASLVGGGAEIGHIAASPV